MFFTAKAAVERRAFRRGYREGRREVRARVAKLLAKHGVAVSPELARYLAGDGCGDRSDD